MAKLHLDRLKDRYPSLVKGDDYKGLMSEIIANNHENIQRAVGRMQTEHFQRAASRIKRSTNQQIAVPALEEVLPKRSVFARKGAEQGQILTDSLRDRLTRDLRQTVVEYLQTGANSMQYKQGERRGRMNPKLVAALQQRMTESFSGYTRGDRPGEIPANIQSIAETEIRSSVSDIKHTYAQKLQEQNPGKMQITKVWRHHPGLSVRPRQSHRVMDGVERPLGVPFEVPILLKLKTGWVWGPDKTYMQHPHDPSAPAEQVINCHCECDYITRILG